MGKQHVFRISWRTSCICDVFPENLKRTSSLTGKLEVFFKLNWKTSSALERTSNVLESFRQNFRYPWLGFQHTSCFTTLPRRTSRSTSCSCNSCGFAPGIMGKQQVLRISSKTSCIREVFLENVKYTSSLTGKLEIFSTLDWRTWSVHENLQENSRYP